METIINHWPYLIVGIVVLFFVIRSMFSKKKPASVGRRKHLPTTGGASTATPLPLPASASWYEAVCNYLEQFPDSHKHIWATLKAIGNALKRGSVYVLCWILLLIILANLIPDVWRWYWGHQAIFWTSTFFLLVLAIHGKTIFGKDNTGAKIAAFLTAAALIAGICVTLAKDKHSLALILVIAVPLFVALFGAYKSKDLKELVKFIFNWHLGLIAILWFGCILWECTHETQTKKTTTAKVKVEEPKRAKLLQFTVRSDMYCNSPTFDPFKERFAWDRPEETEKPLLVIDTCGRTYINVNRKLYRLYTGSVIPQGNEWIRVENSYGKEIKKIEELDPVSNSTRNYFQFRAMNAGDEIVIQPMIGRIRQD